MKKLLLAVLTATILFFTTKTTAQEVKSQSEIIRNEFKAGYYKVIAGYQAGQTMEIVAINPDKSQPEDHFEVILVKVLNYPNEKIKFYADKPYFSTNYISSGYEGNDEYKKKYGYIVRRGSYAGRERLVFYKGKVYELSSWKDKDHYQIDNVLVSANAETNNEPKKKKKSFKGFFKGFGKQKASSNSSNKGTNSRDTEGYKKEIQPYLDAAVTKQQNLANSDKAKKLEAKAKNFDKKTNSFVEEFNNFTAFNDTGKTVYLYDGGSTKATKYKAGATIVRLRCADQLWFDFTGKRYRYPNNVILFHKRSRPKCYKEKYNGKPVRLSNFQ